MAMTSLFLLINSSEVPRSGDATHAHWQVGHSLSRLWGQTGWDGL